MQIDYVALKTEYAFASISLRRINGILKDGINASLRIAGGYYIFTRDIARVRCAGISVSSRINKWHSELRKRRIRIAYDSYTPKT